MTLWLETKARRLTLAAAVAFAVGVPTLACTGSADVAEDVADEPAEDGLAAKSVGNWRVKPSDEELRQLKILDMAINKEGSNVGMLQKKLKPPPTPEEIATFELLKSMDPNSPDMQFAKMQLEMMKSANLEITSSKWNLTFGGETESWSYTVQSESGSKLVVKLDSGEVNELNFVDDDNIKVTLKDDLGEMELQFARK